jgi:hypothetical protein
MRGNGARLICIKLWKEFAQRVINFAQTWRLNHRTDIVARVLNKGAKAMFNVTHLRMRAKSCLRLSDRSQDPEMRDCLVSMAQTYLAVSLGLKSSETAGSSEDGTIGSPWFRDAGASPPATEEIPMRQRRCRVDESAPPTDPLCPNCAGPMWLFFVNHLGPREDRHLFECIACNIRTVLPTAG